MPSHLRSVGISPERPLGDIGEAHGVRQLHKVDQGRLFYRNVAGGMVCLVGVVHIPGTHLLGDKPADWPMECLMPARLNGNIWLDLEHAQPFARQLIYREEIEESDVGGLIRSLQWKSGFLPDTIQMGLRQCPIEDGQPGVWAIAFGASNKPIAGMTVDGLYEFDGNKPVLVDSRAFNGESIGHVLTQTLWGPNGDLGLLTSLRMDIYPKWIGPEQERNRKTNDRYGQFLDLMKDREPLPMVYTAEQKREHDEAVRAIVQSMYVKERLADMASLHQAVACKARPA